MFKGFPQPERAIVSFIAMSRLKFSTIVLLGILALVLTPACKAEWTKDITCPAGTVYRDLREYAGREEFCERLLPGSIRVKDGPYRFWYIENLPETRGDFHNGRQVGRWLECDKYGNCKHANYQLSEPSERSALDFGRRSLSPIITENMFSILHHAGARG
jgi:hypothetical protein